MTKEEKQARAAKRQAEKEKRALLFPGASLRNARNIEKRDLIIELQEGDHIFLNIHVRGEWSYSHRGEGWTEAYVSITDPRELISFLHALTARYNAMVDEMNEHAKESAVKRLVEM